MIRVSLDGNEVLEPIDTSSISEHLYYSKSLSSYVLEIDGGVTFTGSEYTYIRDIFDSNVCGSTDIKIWDDTNNDIDFDGIINVADVTFFPDTRLAVCEIQNNNITSLIENNKSIDCVLTAGRSKNDVDYAVNIQTDITIYNPTGAHTITRKGMRVWDAFDSIINFITDGELGFVSDYFNPSVSTNLQAFSVLMNGEELRTGLGFAPTISFSELFNDMNSLENLQLSFDNGNIRIENKDYFKQQASSVTFDNVEDLSQELAIETLYARVKFGGISVAPNFDYLQNIRFNGMVKEEYHLGGQCNTDTQLDISTQALIIDANAIQDVIPHGAMGGNGNESFDDDVLIIHCNSSNEAFLTLKPASSTHFYYNDRFTNRNVALRWLGQIPQSIFAFLGNGLNGCNIRQDSVFFVPNFWESFQPTQESPAPWNDPNNNYAVGTKYMMSNPTYEGDPDAYLWGNITTMGFYTAPANGVYSFEFEVITTTSVSSWFIQRMISNTIDGAGGGFYGSTQISLGGGLYSQTGGATFYMNTGDYVGVKSLQNTATGSTIMPNSTFKCIDSGSGITQTYVSSDVYQIQNKLTYPINITDWRTIKLLPFQYILLTYQTGQTNGWLKDISRRITTGEAEVVLLGRQN